MTHSPQSDADGLILANAERLLDDARLLFCNERYKSALALAVIAIEEVGKILVHRWSDEAELKYARRQFGYHALKQIATLTLIQTVTTILWISTKRGLIKAGELNEKSFDSFSLFAADENVSLSEHEKMTLLEMFRDQRRTERSLKRGDFDRMKQAALYVDPFDNDDSPVIRDAKEAAENSIKIANYSLSFLNTWIVMEFTKHFYKDAITASAQTDASPKTSRST